MRQRIPASAGVLESVDDARCLLRCGANPIGSVIYWLLAMDLEFEVLGPPALIERLRQAGERVARSLTQRAVDPAPRPAPQPAEA